MYKRELEKCMLNGPLVRLLLFILNQKWKLTIQLKSMYNNKRLSETLVQQKCLTWGKTCSKWLVLKNAFSAGNVRRQRSCLTWTTLRTTFRLVHIFLILGKKKDKFIFTVESVGQLQAATIVKKSISVLRAKLHDLRERIEWTMLLISLSHILNWFYILFSFINDCCKWVNFMNNYKNHIYFPK